MKLWICCLIAWYGMIVAACVRDRIIITIMFNSWYNGTFVLGSAADNVTIYPRYRFAEIYYRRGESGSHKGRTSSQARVETTIIFLPDVWNICPTKLEWDGLHLNYKRQLEKKLLGGGNNATNVPSSNDAAAADQSEDDEMDDDHKALIFFNTFLTIIGYPDEL